MKKERNGETWTRQAVATALVLLLVLASASLTFAAYSSRSYVKGVAASPKQDLSLSSDYLSVVSGTMRPADYPVRTVLLEKKAEGDTSPYTIPLTIRNSSTGSTEASNMQYVLKASNLPEGTKIIATGEKDVTSYVTSSVGYTAPVMLAYSSVTHEYRIELPPTALNEIVNITMSATPTVDSGGNGFILAAIIHPNTVGTAASFSYSGFYLDEGTEKAPSAFAAFNYEISVSNATEPHTMVLSWKPEKVEIDPFFLTKTLGIKHDQVANIQQKGSIEISMQSEVNDHYLVKFYRKTGRSDSAWPEWSGMGISFEPLEAEAVAP